MSRRTLRARSRRSALDDPTQAVPPTGSAPVTVFLLDDHDVVRRGVADLIATDPGITVVGEARTAHEALTASRPCARMSRFSTPACPTAAASTSAVTSARRCPQVRCVILTSYDDNDALMAAVLAGASGYLLKEIRGSSLVDAIRTVAAGRSLIDPAVLQQVLTRLRDGAPTDPRLASLTPREREILALIADGLTNRQIGERMFLAEKTVKNYVSVAAAQARHATPQLRPRSTAPRSAGPRCHQRPGRLAVRAMPGWSTAHCSAGLTPRLL